MDTKSKLIADQVYRASFSAAILLLPWSTRLCSYALVIMGVTGLLTSNWNEKAKRLRQYSQTWIFITFYALYIAGLLYTSNLTAGFITLEQKLALLIIPFIVATSVPLGIARFKLIMLGFVYSNALFTITCLIINTYMMVRGELPPQINFDHHTLSNFSSFHPDAHPAWLQFSYIGLTNSITSPVYLSIYLTFCILILLHLPRHNRTRKIFQYAGMIWFSLVILLLASRTGILVFFIVVTANIVIFLIRHNASLVKTSFISLSFIAATILLILVLPVTRFRLIDEFFSTPTTLPSSPEKWNSINLRYLEWTAGLELIKTNILFGTGTGGTLDALQTYYERVDLGDFEYKYDSHNQYIETYLELGLAGFIFLLLSLLGPMMFAVKNRNKLLFSLVVIIALTCLSASALERFKGLVFYTSFVSLFMFSKREVNE